MKPITLAAALLIPMSLVGPNAALAANGTWSSTTEPDAIKGANTATLLKDGRVFVVGSLGNEMTAEIYDPTSATWTRQADPIRTRTLPPASASAVTSPYQRGILRSAATVQVPSEGSNTSLVL